MENGVKYVVTTKLGTFCLDEGAYQDYLAGNHWICWGSGDAVQPRQTAAAHRPVNVTARAAALRDQADRDGVVATLRQLGVRVVTVPYSTRLAEVSIDEMNLSARSTNGLKRAGAGTFGRLRDLMAMENGLLSVRNLGQKSAREIKRAFFEECYGRLQPYEKLQYWQDVLDAG